MICSVAEAASGWWCDLLPKDELLKQTHVVLLPLAARRQDDQGLYKARDLQGTCTAMEACKVV